MIKDVEHILAWHDPEHACNQGSLVRLQNGELLLGYNQERGKRHADSGQSCLIRSRDGGRTWDPETNRWVSGSFSSAEIYRGDSVLVPRKLVKIHWIKEAKDITQIMFQIAVVVGVIAAL